jgi:predicted AAA+ superfamily ATPase
VAKSSESLAGRIRYINLTPFQWCEVRTKGTLEDYIARGGFPKSFLEDSDDASFIWREEFISTFLERDLLEWSGFSPRFMQRLWQMLAWDNGLTVTYSTLSASLGLNSTSIKNYIDLLSNAFMVDIVRPWHSNKGKRLVKAPKVYIADSGIALALMDIHSFNQAMGNPSFGFIWESVVLQAIRGLLPHADVSYYRTSAGAEIDFVINDGNKITAVECKASRSPALSKGNFFALDDICPAQTLVASPVEKGWPYRQGIDVVSLDELRNHLACMY